ncbi:hypothetical protein BG004_004333, partial [Podila humilis]
GIGRRLLEPPGVRRAAVADDTAVAEDPTLEAVPIVVRLAGAAVEAVIGRRVPVPRDVVVVAAVAEDAISALLGDRVTDGVDAELFFPDEVLVSTDPEVDATLLVTLAKARLALAAAVLDNDGIESP